MDFNIIKNNTWQLMFLSKDRVELKSTQIFSTEKKTIKKTPEL